MKNEEIKKLIMEELSHGESLSANQIAKRICASYGGVITACYNLCDDDLVIRNDYGYNKNRSEFKIAQKSTKPSKTKGHN